MSSVLGLNRRGILPESLPSVIIIFVIFENGDNLNGSHIRPEE